MLDNDDKNNISFHLSHNISSHARLVVRLVVAKKGQIVHTIVVYFNDVGVSLSRRACGDKVHDSVNGSSRVDIEATL